MGFLKFSTSDRVDLGALSAVFLIFAVICFITAIVYDSTEETILSSSFTGKEKILGPIEIKQKDTVLAIEVNHHLAVKGTYGAIDSFVEGEVLDHKRDYLFSFGKEFWAEAGYDEGHYHESDTYTTMKVTLPEAGTFYLRFKAEGDLERAISVTASRLAGSGLLHRVFGVFALIAGIVFFWLGIRGDWKTN